MDERTTPAGRAHGSPHPYPPGVEGFLLSGELHHWRLNPDLWPEILDRVRDLGFRYVATYLPWAAHETAPGACDFTGPRDLTRFCTLAAERGLKVFVRVGPDSGAELPTSGWPRRILDDPRCQAHRPDGRPYLLVTATHHAFMPSYAASATLEAVAGWYDAVTEVLRPLQHPGGPVFACQVDNEMGYHFQPHPYALDYHPEALDAYRTWLLEVHGGLDTVNAAYGSAASTPDELEPPRDGDEQPERRRVDWVEWKETHRVRALATLSGMLRDRGITVPIVHNDYPRTQTPIDTGALEASGVVDLAAGDIYAPKEGGRFVTDYVRHLAGSTRLPFLAEVGAGWLALPWLLPMATTPADEEVCTLRALGAGVRAMNVYMLVERDRWYGSPISARGEIREDRARLYRRLHDVLDDLDWTSLRRRVRVLLLENRVEHRRLVARHRLGEAVPCFSQLLPIDRRLAEPDDHAADELRRWTNGFEEILARSGVDYDRASSSSPPALERYDLVLMPVLDTCEQAAWERLLDGAASGVRVAVGPSVPRLDERLRSHAFEAGDIALLGSPEQAARLLSDPPYRCSHEDVDVHHLAGGGREVLVTANHSARPVSTTLHGTGPLKLVGRWGPGEAAGTDTVELTLGPWEVQIWEVL